MIRNRASGAVVVTIDQDAVAKLASPGQMVDRYTIGKARSVAVFARRFAPVKSGRLRAGIGVEQSREATGRYKVGYDVVSKAAHSVFVVKGTRPHVIRPKSNSGVLRFMVGNTVVFARSVNHPGTKANDFLDRALVAGMKETR